MRMNYTSMNSRSGENPQFPQQADGGLDFDFIYYFSTGDEILICANRIKKANRHHSACKNILCNIHDHEEIYREIS